MENFIYCVLGSESVWPFLVFISPRKWHLQMHIHMVNSKNSNPPMWLLRMKIYSFVQFNVHFTKGLEQNRCHWLKMHSFVVFISFVCFRVVAARNEFLATTFFMSIYSGRHCQQNEYTHIFCGVVVVVGCVSFHRIRWI